MHAGLSGWNTNDELEFLRGLGTYRLHGSDLRGPLTKTQRIQSLTLYLKTMRARVEWGGIDPFVVQDAIQEMIAGLQRVEEAEVEP